MGLFILKRNQLPTNKVQWFSFIFLDYRSVAAGNLAVLCRSPQVSWSLSAVLLPLNRWWFQQSCRTCTETALLRHKNTWKLLLAGAKTVCKVFGCSCSSVMTWTTVMTRGQEAHESNFCAIHTGTYTVQKQTRKSHSTKQWEANIVWEPLIIGTHGVVFWTWNMFGICRQLSSLGQCPTSELSDFIYQFCWLPQCLLVPIYWWSRQPLHSQCS